MNSILTITHRADFDGLCSQAIARKSLGETSDYLGWDYGDPIPDLAPYETVYLIDISLPREVMVANTSKLIWIDHHKSAIDAMKDTWIHGYRIDGVAACRLAWQWFSGHGQPTKQAFVDRTVSEPYAVQLLGEFDIWDKRNPDVDVFQLGMQAEKAPNWALLLTEDGKPHDEQGRPTIAMAARNVIDQIIGRGRAIQSYTDLINAQIITERGFDVVFEGLTFRALNIARCNSLTFTAAIKEHHQGCLAYHWNGSKWRFSLYHVDHRKDIDLSLIAVKHGGGGHRGAAGMELDTLPEVLGGCHGAR